MKLNNRGFSLVSVMMAAAMVGGLSLVMMQMSKQSSKSTVKFQFDTEVTQITNEINGILSNPASCLATVQQATLSQVIHVPPTGSLVNKYTTSGGPYGNAGIKISSYTLNLTGTDEANLQINFVNKGILKNTGGTNNTISKTIKLEITPSSATTSATVTSCRSVSSATDTMWSRQAGTPANIFYNSGNVGIGTNGPAAKLHVMESVLFTNLGTDAGKSYVPTTPILTVTTDGNGVATTEPAYADNAVFKVGIGGGSTGNVTKEHFRVNLNGNVGIGTAAAPVTKLDVAGGMRVGDQTQVTVCDAVTEGTQRYNKSSHAMEYCGASGSPLVYVWKGMGGGGVWTNLALSNTAPFDPKCIYVMNGAQAGYVDSSMIMSVLNGISSPSTATWSVIYSASKGSTYMAQDNWSNNTYYGASATTSISFICP